MSLAVYYPEHHERLEMHQATKDLWPDWLQPPFPVSTFVQVHHILGDSRSAARTAHGIYQFMPQVRSSYPISPSVLRQTPLDEGPTTHVISTL